VRVTLATDSLNPNVPIVASIGGLITTASLAASINGVVILLIVRVTLATDSINIKVAVVAFIGGRMTEEPKLDSVRLSTVPSIRLWGSHNEFPESQVVEPLSQMVLEIMVISGYAKVKMPEALNATVMSPSTKLIALVPSPVISIKPMACFPAAVSLYKTPVLMVAGPDAC
jgi:hypothetical protein